MAPLVVIVGETASGKSALAMQIAEYISAAAASRLESVSVRDREAQANRTNGTVQRASKGHKPEMAKKTAESSALPMSKLADLEGAEIICADSWTVYRGFDIGTAKPSNDECRQVPHHLLDIADPPGGFSAAEFKSRAMTAIVDITNRGKLPILVGGTGLYIDSVIFNYGFLPPGEPKERETLSALSIEDLLQIIQTADVDIAGIDVRNKRRLIRLIETKGRRPAKANLRSNTLIIGLNSSKDNIQQRVATRVDTMLASGLEQEVRNLAKRYGWGVEPMKGIGYREFKDYFAGQQTLEQTRERIIRSTFQLGKKQRTWFKRNKSIQWLTNSQQALPIVQNFLSK